MPTTVVGKDCPFCNKAGQIITIADYADYQRWLGGTNVQVAMPYLTSSEREALMTGICDPCWDETFHELED